MTDSKWITEINHAQFQEILSKEKGPFILDFYSTECAPCDALAPKYEAMAELFANDIKFYKIFRQENRELALDLGVKSSPTLLFYKDGKEMGNRLMGGIRKEEIKNEIKKLIGENLYSKKIATIPLKKKEVDVAILGGGPAGLTAAIYASQARLQTIIIDTALTGGQVATTHKISNFPGTGTGVSGWELMEKSLHQAKESGTQIMAAVDVTSVEFSKDGLHRIMVDAETEIFAKSVILATGSEPRKLGVFGEKELKGKGIHYCATCDGKYYEGKEVVVIGGGNSAVEESIFLSKFATKIKIVHQFDTFQANKLAQEEVFRNEKISVVWSHEPRRFEVVDERMVITVENMKTHEYSQIETDGVFIFAGMVPNTAIFKNSGIQMDAAGYIPTDEDMMTNIPSVYAAGDIRIKKIRQAVTAASDGAIAAIMAERFLAERKRNAESKV